ncbi:MAG: putative bifunctional diguanylate cyclase/phosphodiesterase [Actinomycetes bacterium]
MTKTWPGAARPALMVALLSTALAAAGLALLFFVHEALQLSASSTSLALAAFVGLLYVIAESTQFHLEVRRQAFSVSISDLPLVLGLFFLPPWWLIGIRLGTALVVFVARRMAPLKAWFNLGLFSAEVGVAVALFHLLEIGAGRTLSDWVLTYLVVLVADVFGSYGVIVAMGILQGLPASDARVRMLVSVMVSGLLTTTVALLGVLAIDITTWGLLLLAVLIVLLSAAHRAYFALLRRHTDLGQLLGFTQSVGALKTTEEMTGTVLQQARELLQAEDAVLRPPADVDRDGLAAGEAHVIDRHTRDPFLREWLGRAGLRDALLVPLHDEDDLVGVLQVGNRLGAVSTFTPDDLRLLQTVAAHTEVIWRNGRLLEKLSYDAHHDTLTGLVNRNRFRQRLAELLSELPQLRPASHDSAHPVDAVKNAECEAAVLLLDLDRFKEINDALGHPVGDMLLRAVGERIVRAVPDDAEVARIGGDEFAVLLPSCSSSDDAVAVAAACRDALNEPFEVQGSFLDLGAAVGIAVVPADGHDADIVLRRADVAVTSAKQQTNGLARYGPEDDRNSRHRLALASDLRRGMEVGQIDLHYQPKVDAETSRLLGFEALARWQHPERGMVPPDEFIPLAEHTGLIGRLTQIALAQALKQTATWSRQRGPAGMAVNLSARRLHDPELPAMVAGMLADTAVPPRLLTLEITESSLMTDPAAATRALHELKDIGIRLSVDDFGTGYSALSYLQRLPVDEVKIDRSFVMPMLADAGAYAIVKAIIELAHTLDLSVVAEGVEDDDSQQALHRLGCDVLQGYHISRPMPRQQVDEWVRDWQRRNHVRTDRGGLRRG